MDIFGKSWNIFRHRFVGIWEVDLHMKTPLRHRGFPRAKLIFPNKEVPQRREDKYPGMESRW